jgi:phosphocarrier protein HPr
VKSVSQQVTVQLSEDKTIIELSNTVQSLDAQIFLRKNHKGDINEIDLKSFLGLITMQLHNGDTITVRAEGEDREKALRKVVDFLT